MAKRLLITGSRNWTSHKRIMIAVTNQWVKWDKPKDALLISGNCPTGADRIAENVWDELGLTIEFHPANWKRHGKQAGFIRNQEMVDLGADFCLAFICECVSPSCTIPYTHPSHGASHTVAAAERAGIQTRIYTG
jgi:hypothetical protein